MRRLIYTTNAIEGFNRQLRKVTRAKSVFPTDDSLLKMLYLAMMDITKKWTGRRQDWSVIHGAAVHLFCRTHARITPPEPDVKGLRAAVRGAPMNGGLAAALDIHPPPALYCTQGGSRINPLPRTMDDPALFMPHLEFTQNLGLTPLAHWGGPRRHRPS